MAKSKHRKNHKAKVSARNEKINQEKKKIEKLQREFIMNLIKKEQESGLFENTQNIQPVNTESSFDGPTLEIEGPSI